MRVDRDPDPYRLYAIIRKDLDMSPGKIAAQAGHAFLDAYEAAKALRPDTIPEYKTRHGIKVCLVAKSLRQIERAHEQALEAGIPCALITDLGYTVFEGKPTVTALGVGPAKKTEVDFLKRFQLMK